MEALPDHRGHRQWCGLHPPRSTKAACGNQQEIAGNGLDDDNNGYVDGIYGVSDKAKALLYSGDQDDHDHEPPG